MLGSWLKFVRFVKGFGGGWEVGWSWSDSSNPESRYDSWKKKICSYSILNSHKALINATFDNAQPQMSFIKCYLRLLNIGMNESQTYPYPPMLLPFSYHHNHHPHLHHKSSHHHNLLPHLHHHCDSEYD